jgi:hypothetical protein
MSRGRVRRDELWEDFSAGGGGGSNSNRTLSRIGINLSPGTVYNYDENCKMAIEFYIFLIEQGETFTHVPFFDVPTITMKQEGYFNNKETSIDAENNIQLLKNFCIDKDAQIQMYTEYLINNKPGVLTMTGVIKNQTNKDIVFYVLTLYFDQDKKGDWFVTINGFCKNNPLQINGSRIGVDLFLILCEEFNNNKTRTFNIKYCSVEPLPGLIEWWRKFGFYFHDFSKKGTQKRNIMDRYFPDTQASVPFSQGDASIISDTSEGDASMIIDTPAPASKQIGFETLQGIVAENLEGNRGNAWNYDYDKDHFGGKKKKTNKKKTNKSKTKRCLNKVKRSRRRSRRF